MLAPLDARPINTSSLLIEHSLQNVYANDRDCVEFDPKPNSMSTIAFDLATRSQQLLCVFVNYVTT